VYPVEALEPGDVLITNDPWIAIGHLNDTVVITPIWYGGKVAAFAANAANVADIGGRGMGTQGTSIYEEGIQIPILKLHERGKVKEDIYRIIKQNVRMSDQVVGDIRAQVASNDVCARRLVEFMDQNGVTDFTQLATAIQGRAEDAMRRAIREIPDGTYSHTSMTYGVDEEVTIKVTLHVKGDQIIADYDGTSPQSKWGINSVLNYTFAYTAYAIKCVVAPHVPNNEGCMRPVTVIAPERTIVNPMYPAPVAARSQTGKFLPIPVMRALAQAVPGKVIADSGSAPLWCPTFRITDETTGKQISHMPMLTGGLGARPSKDGISAIDFPSVIINVPVEMNEHRFPIMIRRWNLIPDSGGPGRFRGGMGFDFEVENVAKSPILATLRCERTEHPALGAEGGHPGSRGRVTNGDGANLDPHRSHALEPGGRILFGTAGGGGYGPPMERDVELVRQDVEDGWVTVQAAADIYGTVIDPKTGKVDRKATEKKRAKPLVAGEVQ
jgi:N-methylhydantoinase B